MKTANTAQKRYCDAKEGVELRESQGESSIDSTSSKRRDESEKHQDILLEHILDRDNLNRAYKRVVRNGGSCGVDGMKTEARLDSWIRRRLRMCYWKQWKKLKTKRDYLARLGLSDSKAW